jgi:hypothetical protein
VPGAAARCLAREVPGAARWLAIGSPSCRATSTSRAAASAGRGSYELPVPLELPMCVQWCVGDPADAELDPADALEPVDADVEDVVAVLVVAGVAEPVDASATPATPPPSAAPITPVITSRRMRPVLLGSIMGPPSVLGPPRARRRPPMACAQ